MAGDASYANVVLLLNGDGTTGSTSILDSSLVPKSLTASGGAAINTTNKVFGSGSIGFTAGKVTAPYSTDYDFGAGDFTVEFSLLLTSTAVTGNVISNGWKSSPATYSGFLVLVQPGVGVTFFATSNGSSWDIALGLMVKATPSLNTFYHLAITRQGSTIRTFADGVHISTATSALPIYIPPALPLFIGGTTAGDYLAGNIDNLRLTKGVARYTTTFTPPAAAFPEYTTQISGTVVDSTGTPASRTVRAYRRDTGAFLKEGVSTSGSYNLKLPYAGEVNVICLDDVAGTTENDLILRTTAS